MTRLAVYEVPNDTNLVFPGDPRISEIACFLHYVSRMKKNHFSCKHFFVSIRQKSGRFSL